MRRLVFVSNLVLFLPAARPPLEVSTVQGRITIRATAVPLSDILEELSRKTGIEVVFESARPRQAVTTTITALPEEDAIAKLLEGLPLSWGLRRGARGRVETLVIAGDPSRRPTTPRPRASPTPGTPREPSAASYPSEPDRASYPPRPRP
jgi:hypothetical protein